MPQKGIWGSNPQLSARKSSTMDIELEKIFNARDLGGMRAADGKLIKPKRLIRSSCLYGASKKDAKTLLKEYSVKNVVDFRYSGEREEKPHPNSLFKDANYYTFPCFETIVNAFTRDKESLKLLQNQGNFTEEDAVKFIETFYR